MIYLDNNSTTQIDKEINELIYETNERFYGNPSSNSGIGKQSRDLIEKARADIGEYLGCERRKLFFTSSATESNNFVFYNIASNLHIKTFTKKKIIISAIEHPSVLKIAESLKEQGLDVDYASVDRNGVVIVEEIRKKIDENTLLVSVMAANNETGVCQPIEEIAEITASAGAMFHTDATQFLGKSLRASGINFKNISFLSASAHKIHGPKGVGVMYCGVGFDKINPMILGGGQEFGLRSGTENISGIGGMGAAFSRISEDGIRKMSFLRDEFENLLKDSENTTLFNGKSVERIANTSNLSFLNAEGEALVTLLASDGVVVSTASACSSKKLEPSHVLQAMKVPKRFINNTVRISISNWTRSYELDVATRSLRKNILRLNRTSPLNI